VEKYHKKINIAFCFNGQGCELAAVSISSLLQSSGGACDYNIYCVVDKSVSVQQRQRISGIVRGAGSTCRHLAANHDFDKSFLLNWPIAIYYRMMLPKLLPDLDKVIYADIDTIFCRDLVEASRINMGRNILAGVKDYPNGYINSGFLVMNLKQIRAEGLYEKWLYYSQRKKYKNPDQDLLNYTTRGRIVFLPLKYNFQPMMGSWIHKAHNDREISNLRHHLVVLHFSNWMKPWHAPERRPIFSEIWWRFADKITP